MTTFDMRELEWLRMASCTGLPTEWFMPKEDGSLPNYSRAERTCAMCPVKKQCLDYALSLGTDNVGYWGGTTHRERLRILRGGSRHGTPIPHGTVHGFYRERRAGKTPCASCRQAWADAKNDKAQQSTIALGEIITLIHGVVDDPQGS